jgi:O-methyltransferase involved in polyketide biosynthesis
MDGLLGWRGYTLFTAAGVLYYVEPQEVKTLFCRLADRFPGSQLCFDA